MNGYVVVFEGDEESGYSSYSPDLPGVVAAGETLQETQELMLGAMIAHIGYLRDSGQRVPDPVTNARVAIVDVSAA
jgi:predicted RNase H-like HicB family nuclease